MKQILATLLLLISAMVKADTTDYWHVYINDSLIAQYNDNSKGSLFFHLKNLDTNTVFKVRYYTCGHSAQAINRIGLIDSLGNVFVINSYIGTGEPVEIKWSDFKFHLLQNGDTIFNVVLMNASFNSSRKEKILFQIVIENY